MADLDKLIEELSSLTVLEAADLAKKLEDAWGVSAAAPVAVAAVAGGASDEVVKEEQTAFDVVIESFGASKIAVIKEVRAITGLGLKEAKELVESAPKPIKEGVDQATADEIKGKLEEVGATISVK